MATNNYIKVISEDECMGDSLVEKINPNFQNLDTAVTELANSFTTAFHCERYSAGTVGGYMSYGNGAATHQGLRMPYRGELISATLQVYNMTGTVTVDPAINGVTNTNFRLTTTGTNLSGGVTQLYDPPLSFNADNTLGWQQITVPTSANAYNVTYIVKMYTN